MITENDRLKSRMKELTKYLGKPKIFNGCNSKYVSVGGPWGESWDTLGVKADIVRIYMNYTLDRTLGISFYKKDREFRIKIDSEQIQNVNVYENYSNAKRNVNRDNILGLDLNYAEFSLKLNKVLNIFKNNPKNTYNKNLNIMFREFNLSELLI